MIDLNGNDFATTPVAIFNKNIRGKLIPPIINKLS